MAGDSGTVERARLGVITGTDPLTVRLDGASTDNAAIRCASYTPTVGHKVAVLPLQGRRVLIIDQVKST